MPRTRYALIATLVSLAAAGQLQVSNPNPVGTLSPLALTTANNAIAMTDSSGVASWTTSVETVLTGSGHPQGVLSAAVGRLYRDTTGGGLYRKIGGSTTAYGWYLVRNSSAGQPFLYFDYFSIGGSWIGDGVSDGSGTSAGGSASRGTFAEGSYYRRLTQAAVNATGSYSGDQGATSMMNTTYDWDVVFNMRTDSSSIAGTRMLIGVSTTNPDLASAAPTTKGIWFRYDTVAGDSANWMGYAHDGVTLSSATTICAIAAATPYKLRIRKVSTTAYLSCNDGTEVTLSNNVPTGDTYVGPSMRLTTSDGVAKSLWSFYRGVSVDFKGS